MSTQEHCLVRIHLTVKEYSDVLQIKIKVILKHEYSYVKKTRINEEISRARGKHEIEF